MQNQPRDYHGRFTKMWDNTTLYWNGTDYSNRKPKAEPVEEKYQISFHGTARELMPFLSYVLSKGGKTTLVDIRRLENEAKK